ncbi:MAG: methyltransferase domain-containing protein [Arenicellales bacterium]|nr:methyltransferase domain-containing protein [Arenicellales bacterium]
MTGMAKTPDIGLDDVRVNYNAIGIDLIEAMYSDDYLSMGGIASTDILARKSGIGKDSRILDVGSGLGGPALHLAAVYGCRVTGLDVIELNILEAEKRAKTRQLDHLVDFTLGDATDMPFSNGTYDVILGQDAWCHIGEKNQLIEECARVLAPNGTIAFTDWLQTGQMDDQFQREILSAFASPGLATLESYHTLLTNHGFSNIEQEDIGEDFVNEYRRTVTRLKNMEEQVTRKYSSRVFQIVLEKNSLILRALEEDKMGGGRFVGNKQSV